MTVVGQVLFFLLGLLVPVMAISTMATQISTMATLNGHYVFSPCSLAQGGPSTLGVGERLGRKEVD